jgi:carboxyvinyl-carboxyphosphonate phosphorylmutase
MDHTEERKRFRAVLAGSKCISPASVYDALSARIAEAVGYEIGMLAGSVASNSTLAAPDLIVLTLTEFADQVRRIKRASRLPLLVDADHGYGNALNVMRTVWELDHAGVSCMSIEDPVLPLRFGQAEGSDELISTAEMVGKLKAAVEARGNSSVLIAGRTAALRAEGVEGTVARVKAYSATGVDAIFVVGLETLAQLEAIHAATKLPLILGGAPASLKREELAARGARVALQGHQPIAAAAKALRDVYEHLHRGGAPADLKDRIITAQEMDKLVSGADHKRWIKDYLR